MKSKTLIFFILFLGIVAGFFDYPKYFNRGVDFLNSSLNIQTKFKIPHFINREYRLGLDLLGGTHLVYQADLTNILSKDRQEAMNGVKNVIERRVNIFGVSEPNLQVSKAGDDYRLIVELAGIKDINTAINIIGETPYLDFRESKEGIANPQSIDDFFVTTLNGQYLEKSNLSFNPTTGQPVVELQFNDEGAKIFEKLTEKNIGKILPIFLDGLPISVPVVQDKITGGKAVITGDFTVKEAKELVSRLNAGALPVKINLISQKTIGPTLGYESLILSLKSALYAFVFVALFMIIWYRLPGILAVLALLVYTAFVLAIFKLIPVTLTLSGIAGFILSIGMAVDANILIFARMKEEIRSGKSLETAVREGVSRAWSSIRDSNISTLLTCLVLYFFTTSVVKGFSLTLAIGVLISMFTAIYVTRLLLGLFTGLKLERWGWLWYR